MLRDVAQRKVLAARMLHGLCFGEEAGARNLVFFRVGWLQPTMKGTSCARRVQPPDDNNHAAIPMRSATTDSRNAKKYGRSNNHSLHNTEEEPIDLETIKTAPAAQRRYLSSSTAATLHGKTQGFVIRAPASSPKQSPCNIHAAITMCFAA